MNRPQARAKLSEFLVGSIEQARAVEKPFYHLQFDRVFPQDIYDAIIRQMPVDRDYRALPGRNNVNILDDGSATRIKIDLFPEYIRNMPAHGHDTQAVFYPRSIAALGFDEPRFVFLVQEVKPPHLCYLVEPGVTMTELGTLKMNRAMRLWADCLHSNRWPSYPPQPITAEAPTYALKEEEAAI